MELMLLPKGLNAAIDFIYLYKCDENCGKGIVSHESVSFVTLR